MLAALEFFEWALRVRKAPPTPSWGRVGFGPLLAAGEDGPVLFGAFRQTHIPVFRGLLADGILRFVTCAFSASGCKMGFTQSWSLRRDIPLPGRKESGGCWAPGRPAGFGVDAGVEAAVVGGDDRLWGRVCRREGCGETAGGGRGAFEIAPGEFDGALAVFTGDDFFV